MRKRELKNVEWSLLIVAIILCTIGLVALFSATQSTDYDEFNKQCIWLIVSLVIMGAIMLIDYETLIKISPILYGIFIILLIAVLFTSPVNGATSWFDIGFFSFQPGEFAKVFVILFLALAISKIQERNKSDINKPTRLLILLAILGVPVLLIIKQPDYGTAAAFIIATALIIMGIVLYVVDKNSKATTDYEHMTLKQTFLIGLAQSLAFIPGVSRSGVTMTVARMLKVDRESAAKYSFMLSAPIVLAATVFKLKDFVFSIPFFVGIFASFIVGILVIKFLLQYLQKGSFKIFAIYRVIFGILIIALTFIK